MSILKTRKPGIWLLSPRVVGRALIAPAQGADRTRALPSCRGPRRPGQAAERRTPDVRRGRASATTSPTTCCPSARTGAGARTSSTPSARSPASWSSTSPPAPAPRASRSPTRGATVVPCDFSLGMLRVGKQAQAAPAVHRRRRHPAALRRRRLRRGHDLVRAAQHRRPAGRPARDAPGHPARAAGSSSASSATRPGRRSAPCTSSTSCARCRPIARAVSSSPDAYVYLAESIRAWPDQPALADLIARSRLAAPRVAQPLRRHRRAAPRDRLIATARGDPRRSGLSAGRRTIDDRGRASRTPIGGPLRLVGRLPAPPARPFRAHRSSLNAQVRGRLPVPGPGDARPMVES